MVACELEVSSAEIRFVKTDVGELKKQWEAQCTKGLPGVGQHLVLELLAENSVLRLDLNMQQEELHKAALQRLKTLEQYTSTVTHGSVGIGFNGEPGKEAEEESGVSDMTDKFKNMFSF